MVEEYPHRVKISTDNRKFLEIDINATIGSAKIAIEYDGSYYHQNKIDKDIAKTKQLLDLGYFVIRIREQSSTITLPFLDFKHENFLQVRHVYKARQSDISQTVAEIVEALKLKQ